jgi:glutamine---fructose-6-phosphate transaminase (isomerizing)
VALGNYEHYLHKELHDAPESFRRTLRGRVAGQDGRPRVSLPDSSLPAQVRKRMAAGGITEVVVVGQGTVEWRVRASRTSSSAIAGRRLHVAAFPASEFSAWYLRRDMTDTLVVAVSQSGSTTDTNRAVDLAIARGSAVISIINRRDSDLAYKGRVPPRCK